MHVVLSAWRQVMENRREKIINHLPLHWGPEGRKRAAPFSPAQPPPAVLLLQHPQQGQPAEGLAQGWVLQGGLYPPTHSSGAALDRVPGNSAPSPRAGVRYCVNQPLGPEISSDHPCGKANRRWLVLPTHTHHVRATGRERGVCVVTHRLFVRAQGTNRVSHPAEKRRVEKTDLQCAFPDFRAGPQLSRLEKTHRSDSAFGVIERRTHQTCLENATTESSHCVSWSSHCTAE